VFSSFHSVITIRKTSAAHADLDVVRDRESSVLSGLSGIPDSLLCNAIAILAKTDRAQLISISDGDGVRLFLRTVG